MQTRRKMNQSLQMTCIGLSYQRRAKTENDSILLSVAPHDIRAQRTTVASFSRVATIMKRPKNDENLPIHAAMYRKKNGTTTPDLCAIPEHDVLCTNDR
jgi:hypothetical protein